VIDLGLEGEVDFVETIVKPTEANRTYGARVHPLRRVPALEAADGSVLFDSRVIVEHLNQTAGGALVPAAGAARIACLNRHAVAAGATEALVSAMYEARVRPAERHWPAWADDQIDKARAGVGWCEARADEFAADFDLGAIALVCLVDYAAFRFADHDWLEGCPRLAGLIDGLSARASVAATRPPA